MIMNAQRRQDIEERFIEGASEVFGGKMAQFFWVRRISFSIMLFLLVLLLIAGCQSSQSSNGSPPITTATPEITADSTAVTSPAGVDSTPCAVPTIVVPTVPPTIPGYAQLDETTGLHVTGKAQKIDLESYRLEVTGKVKHPLKLSYDDLRCMPRIEARPTLICPGFFADTATWAGTPLKSVLELAGVQEKASGIRLISADGYSAPVPLSEALSDKNFLAYAWEGKPLPILHGFPVRAVFPELDGDTWMKWLVKIEVY